MLLTRDQALKEKRTFVTVFFPELDGELRLGAVMASVSMQIQEINARRQKGENVAKNATFLLLIEESIVDEAGAKMFDAAGAAEFYAKLTNESFELLLLSIPGFSDKKIAKPGEPTPLPSETAPVASSPSV